MQERLKEGLLCPACRVDLVMSDRQGIEIDYCPRCRGVWLDRGELDKIIERSAAEAPPPKFTPDPRMSGRATEGAYDDADYRLREDRHRWRDRDDDELYRYRRKKRGGWLDELFEFGD